VVHLTTVHHPFDNRIFHKECKSLTDAGYNVVLIAPADGDQMIDNIFLRALPKPKNKITRMLRTSIQLYKIALAENGEIYHFHDPELIFLGLLLKLKKKTVIYDVHEDYQSSLAQKDYLPKYLRGILAVAFSWLESFFSKFFVIILAEKYYIQRFPRGIHVLNYPNKDNFLLYPLNSPDVSRPMLLYTGSITQDRGACIYASILKVVGDAEVYLVGKCKEELAEKLLESAGKEKHRLNIVGVNRYVFFEEIIDYYRKGCWTAGLAIFPPTPHYFNKELTKFFEYMGAGIPIICSDFPVWRSLMEKTGAGICVNPDNLNEIRDAIEFLVRNPEKAKEMGSNGRRAVLQEYNWENEETKLINFYKHIIPDGRSIF
jgi:glycosyltransferase involved in cell wall biosynthesis